MESQKKLTKPTKSIKVGPWGGEGGEAWDDGSYSGVRSITLSYDRCIDSIRVEYDKHGKPVMADRHGGAGGKHALQIKFKYPEEYLTTISGYISPVVRGGYPVIRSLKFKTNQKTFGPYGVEEGTPFTFPMDGGMVIGFSGRSGWYLDAIGLHVSRIHAMNLYGSVQQKLQKLGGMAAKSLGNKDEDRGSHTKAKASKTLTFA